MSVRFRNSDIVSLLQEKGSLSADEEVEETGLAVPAPLPGQSCDVVFALFMEPLERPDPRWGWPEYLIDVAIRKFQPSPTMVHCELLIPPLPSDEGNRTQFATYYGHHSAWQSDHLDGFGYYLVEHAAHWRAVPIFAHDAAHRLRTEANGELGVDYSLSRYCTSAFPLRAFSSFVPVGRRKPAHCATLLSRVLKNGVPENSPQHSAAWYGPSTLYSELCDRAADYGMALAGGEPSPLMLPKHTEESIDALLRKPMTHDTVHNVGDEGCMDAVRALTLRVTDALGAGDLAAQRITQKQLATALLRWVILRQPLPGIPATERPKVGEHQNYFRA
tara:strand:- start:9181 stop:10176 length:996 start_codon:yes stop_codon:yes gene_type:complete